MSDETTEYTKVYQDEYRDRLIQQDIDRVREELRAEGLDADELVKDRYSLEYVKRASVPTDWLP